MTCKDCIYEPKCMDLTWVSVKDRLPTKNGKYLCYSEYGFVEIFNFSKNLYAVDAMDFPKNEYKGKCGWYTYDGEWGYNKVKNVTHWMPLPEPPKVGENNVQ